VRECERESERVRVECHIADTDPGHVCIHKFTHTKYSQLVSKTKLHSIHFIQTD